MFIAHVCPLCGGKLERKEESYFCKFCLTNFEEDKVERFTDSISKLLDGEKQEKLSNLKNLLWVELHEKKYVDSDRILELTKDILKLYPDDYIAGFFYTANNNEISATAEKIAKFDVRNYGYAVEWVLDFVIKSLEPVYILPTSDLIERAFKNKNLDKYHDYSSRLSREAEKVENGIYDLTIPRDVFVCYSSKDMPKVLELTASFDDEGISYFVAAKNLRQGAGTVQNYEEAIKKAMDYCKIIVFVSTVNSRNRACDAIKFEIPYIRSSDIAKAPVEYSHDYTKLPAVYKKPRVEYLLDKYTDRAIESVVKEFFSGNQWCYAKNEVNKRVLDILTNGWAKPLVDEEKLEAKQKLKEVEEERQRLIEEQNKKIKELEAEKERIRKEAEAKLLAENKLKETERQRLIAEQNKKQKKLEEEKERIRKEAEEKEKLLAEKEKKLKELESKRNQEKSAQATVSPVQNKTTGSTNTQPDYDAEIQQVIEEEKRRTEEMERKIKEADAEAKNIEEEERQRARILKVKQEEQARQEAMKKQLEEIERKKRELKVKSAGVKREGDYIWFGSYPQSEVKDDTIKYALSTLAGPLPTKKNSQKWLSYGYYIKGKKQNYMWYIDLEYNGKKYRGVYFNKYRPYYTGNPSDYTYQKENGYTLNNVYWFAYEPIKWRILIHFNGEAFILSEMRIDSQEYYNNRLGFIHNGGMGYANNYALSNIRKWLNDTFYNTAFTPLQKEIIKLTTVDNSARSTSDSKGKLDLSAKYACGNTQDKVFLLSEQEVTEGTYKFNTDLGNKDALRQKKKTDYAKSQGCIACWWLRSPNSSDANSARYVNDDGSVGSSVSVDCTYCGVVPALKIELE